MLTKIKKNRKKSNIHNNYTKEIKELFIKNKKEKQRA